MKGTIHSTTDVFVSLFSYSNQYFFYSIYSAIPPIDPLSKCVYISLKQYQCIT